MMKRVGRSSKKAGLPPGSLVHVGESAHGPVRMETFVYSADHVEEASAEELSMLVPLERTDAVTWINVTGLHRTDIIESIGEMFMLHPLLLEDVLNTEQRPKLEEYENCLFMAVKMLQHGSDGIDTEHVSLVLTPHTVISFQEKPGDVFAPIRERLRQNKGRIRKAAADYLAYALLDTIVDSYYGILEKLGDTVEALDQDIAADPGTETLRKLNTVKRDLIYLRKSLWPLREMVGELGRGESSLIHDTTVPYLRDVHDHVIHVIDTLETYRDMLNSLHDTYLSNMSNRMNEVMKVLTIISTLFIPLSFLAGLYGMNFAYIPELGWRWGYFTLLGVMALVAGIMLMFFRSKKWL